MALPPTPDLATLNQRIKPLEEGLAAATQRINELERLVLSNHSKLTWTMSVLKLNKAQEDGSVAEVTFNAEYDRQLAEHMASQEPQTTGEEDE